MGRYDWGVGCKASVDNDYSATQSKVTVNCYLVNNGWDYDIGINSWGKCGSSGWGKTSAKGVNSTGVSQNGGWAWAGSYDFYVNKTTSTQTLKCQACIQDASGNSYAGGYTRYSGEVNASISTKTSYTISYNGNSTYNGYTNSTISDLPSSQSKWHGDNITLYSTKPTKENTTTNGYTVTFNANGGNIDTSTVTVTNTFKYTFNKWNTKSDGTGTNYDPGSTFSSNATTTLYAIWNRTETKGSVVLQTPTRSGFTFLGWGTSASQTTNLFSAGSSYTPNSNITLYAIWRANLNDNYVLKTNSRYNTWKDLIDQQINPNSTLYTSGGEYSGWSVDSSGYVVCFGFRIKLNGSTLVKGTDKLIRGAKYYYYIS